MSDHPLLKSRDIARRVVIEGQLQLQTPTHFGNGDTNGITDMPLLLDESSGQALLPGTSLAGALRAYVREAVVGYAELHPKSTPDNDPPPLWEVAQQLFGGEKGDADGRQSVLIIDEALGGLPQIELRDGVRINPQSRTAYMDDSTDKVRGFKYDLELLEPGTTFDLRFELLLPANGSEVLLQVLALALDGLAKGEIGLGLRKRRGFGRCSVAKWHVTEYNLQEPAGLLAWLAECRADLLAPKQAQTHSDIATLLGVQLPHAGGRRRFHMKAEFRLESSLLIRSGFGSQDSGPDAMHLHAQVPGKRGQRQPVLSGTSVAGALRGRSRRILRTLGTSATGRLNERGALLLDELFGPEKIDHGDSKVHASRLVVHETVVRNAVNLVQNRIRIDRLTGGAFDSGLFSEQPIFRTPETRIHVDLEVRNPTEAEIGLLLLLLKDLWTGNLPLGGESSIGRGRLEGLEVTMRHNDAAWSIRREVDGASLVIEGKQAMDDCIAALKKEICE